MFSEKRGTLVMDLKLC